MRKLTLLVLTMVVLGAGAEIAKAFSNGGFEDADLNQATTTITVNPANAEKWWYREDPNGWIRQHGANYPSEGEYCAGIVVDYGNSGGLLQFFHVEGDKATVNLNFDYLLWRGERGSTTAKYSVFGWQENDIIDLHNFINGGPGDDATEILSGDLLSPQYSGDENPGASYAPWSDSASITPGAYQYIGVWFQYTLRGGSFYVDDVKMNLTPVPEPATLGLLGLGGLAILLRNRR